MRYIITHPGVACGRPGHDRKLLSHGFTYGVWSQPEGCVIIVNMEDIRNRLQVELSTPNDVLAYFDEAIHIRELYPEDSEIIARAVFDHTHPSLLSFRLDEKLLRLRDEFGALEAPGLSGDDSDPDMYRDELWQRLKNLVNKNRTV